MVNVHIRYRALCSASHCNGGVVAIGKFAISVYSGWRKTNFNVIYLPFICLRLDGDGRVEVKENW